MALVCIDCRYINGRPSGIGEMTSALIAHLPEMARDLRFRLLASPDGPARLSAAPNVEQVTLRAAANGPATLWWLPRIADLSGVDIFHAPFNVLPAGLSMPTIATIHDLMWLDAPELCEPGLSRMFRARFFAHGITRALDRSTILATVSNATRSAILAHRPDAGGRTFVTRSGVSADFQPRTDLQRLQRLGLDPARRLVLTVGQAAPYKNHDGALEAFALAAKVHTDIDLVLVQRQRSNAQRLIARAEAIGIGQRVHVLPALDRETLVALYSAAALLLHPSLCEGFGHPLAEAMACGCPVVTSDRSAMPEVTSGAAILIDPEDNAQIAAAISIVLRDRELAHKLSKRGLLRAAELRWEDFARANLALYRRLLSGA